MKICPDSIPVSVADCGRVYLATVPVPDGWDDVRKILSRVILHEGRRFVFTGWNSDRLEAYFQSPKSRPASFGTLV